MNDDFTQHFTPILWEPGHMGASLGRLLNDKFINEKFITNQNINHMFKATPQLEWSWVERTYQVMSFNDLSAYNELASKLNCKDEQDLISNIMKFGYLKSVDLFDNSVPNLKLINIWNNGDIDSFIPKLQTLNIDKVNGFSYVKAHLPTLDRVNLFNWKNKIFCTLPQHKAWIGSMFVFYKHFYYFSLDKEFELNRDSAGSVPYFKFFGTNFLNDCENEFRSFMHVYNNERTSHLSGWHYNNLVQPDFTVVDMYKLIFEKDYSELEKITGESVSRTQVALIDQMHDASVGILKQFDLDHTSSLVNDSSFLLNKKIQSIYSNIKQRLK